jgi:hypothetical protein
MTFHSGTTATAKVGATELPVVSWNVDPSVEIQRFINSLTGNFAQKEATFKDARFTLVLDYDFEASPFAATPNLTIGTKVTNVKLYLDGPSGTKFWSFPSAVVVSTPQSNEVAGKPVTTINLENDGTFSAPA